MDRSLMLMFCLPPVFAEYAQPAFRRKSKFIWVIMIHSYIIAWWIECICILDDTTESVAIQQLEAATINQPMHVQIGHAVVHCVHLWLAVLILPMYFLEGMRVRVQALFCSTDEWWCWHCLYYNFKGNFFKRCIVLPIGAYVSMLHINDIVITQSCSPVSWKRYWLCLYDQSANFIQSYCFNIQSIVYCRLA